MDCSLPGSSVHGISQARVLEWVAIPFCRGSSRPRDQTQFSCIKGKLFTIWATREASMIKVLCFVLFCFWRPYHLEIQAKVFIGDMAWCLGFTLKYPVKGLPWWLSGKEFTCQCRRLRFNPWVGKMLWKEMATQSSIVDWETPWTEEPGELQSVGSQRVGHSWASKQEQSCQKHRGVGEQMEGMRNSGVEVGVEGAHHALLSASGYLWKFP